MEKLIQQSNQVCAAILRAQAGSYFRVYRGVTTEQLQRFQNAAARLRGKNTSGVWFDLWLNAEGELVARGFEESKNADLVLVGYEESVLGDIEPVFGGVCLW
ncbi:TPA: hypothetical protein ACNIQM_001835 [Citrobacter werkmanii]